MPVRDRILAYLQSHPEGVDDDALKDALGLTQRQHANTVCRQLETGGLVERRPVEGKIRNFLVDSESAGGPTAPIYSLALPHGQSWDEEHRGPQQRAAIAVVAMSSHDRTEAEPPDASSLAQAGFEIVCEISVQRAQDGTILTGDPGPRYRNVRSLPRNQYGHGPFCRFRISKPLVAAGVYAIVKGEAVLYIGKAANLAERFNNGYGRISPRNCFTKGQETNCRVNKLILSEAQSGSRLDLWFRPLDAPASLERGLIDELRPPWNLA